MLKELFPIFNEKSDLVYLDTAATALKPRVVLKQMLDYYTDYSSNIARGFYPIADMATQKVIDARKKVAEFVSAKPNEIVFTSGATDGMNKVALGVLGKISKEKTGLASLNVVVCENEHHSSLLPIVAQAQNFGLKIKVAKEFAEIESLIDSKTVLVYVTLASNVLNHKVDVASISRVAQKYSALVLVDACQAVSHRDVNFQELGCDFLVFSGHKLYGPTGVGVLVVKESVYSKLDPIFFGGGAVEDVSFDEDVQITLKTGFEALEAGTLPIAEIIGLAAAVEFVSEISMKTISLNEQELSKYLLSELKKLDFIELLEPDLTHAHVISFNIKNVHSHDVAFMLGQKNICVRAGQHCAHLLHKKMGLHGSVRVSFGIYNSVEDCDRLLAELKEINSMFNER